MYFLKDLAFIRCSTVSRTLSLTFSSFWSSHRRLLTQEVSVIFSVYREGNGGTERWSKLLRSCGYIRVEILTCFEYLLVSATVLSFICSRSLSSCPNPIIIPILQMRMLRPRKITYLFKVTWLARGRARVRTEALVHLTSTLERACCNVWGPSRRKSICEDFSSPVLA